VIVHLDTSALIDALTGPRRSLDDLSRLVEAGHRITISTLVFYEWLRGPRTRAELAAQQELFPSASAVPFGHEEAALAARLYQAIPRRRGREMDVAIASCAIVNAGTIWTLNPEDFRDIPDVRLV
jgi:predicted nucleic acid-binding protein